MPAPNLEQFPTAQDAPKRKVAPALWAVMHASSERSTSRFACLIFFKSTSRNQGKPLRYSQDRIGRGPAWSRLCLALLNVLQGGATITKSNSPRASLSLIAAQAASSVRSCSGPRRMSHSSMQKSAPAFSASCCTKCFTSACLSFPANRYSPFQDGLLLFEVDVEASSEFFSASAGSHSCAFCSFLS